MAPCRNTTTKTATINVPASINVGPTKNPEIIEDRTYDAGLQFDIDSKATKFIPHSQTAKDDPMVVKQQFSTDRTNDHLQDLQSSHQKAGGLVRW